MSSPPHSQSAVNELKAQVATYNADLAKHVKWRAVLQKDQDSHNKAVEGYNLSVADANKNAAAFNVRNTEFQQLAVALTLKSKEFLASCEGEKVLRK